MNDPHTQETHAEVTKLKQEVAELWRRFRQHEGERAIGEGADPAREELTGQARVLEGKRDLLVERRSAVRELLDRERRETSRVEPVLQGLGLVAGGVTSAAVAWLLLPELAGACVELGPVAGAALLGLSALFPLLLPSRS
ncbi:MAG: hypothetical protein ACOZQL_24505 [Myxococcota bacterium]